jgi:uncharacterized SAM-dependent methyltransferase
MENKINNLIFKELIKRGYSLRGNTRVWNIADSKLWYLTPEQAQAYLDLERSGEYRKHLFQVELDLLKDFMPQIAEKILHGSAINIIDIGCGDGKKALIPINVLSDKTKIRYCPIDISSHMISRALEEIKKLEKGEVVNFRWNISDFDNLENVASLLRDKVYRQNFFMFLGDTISNFEIHEVMYEIVEAMDGDQDSLMIGLSLANGSPEELIKPYKSKQNDKFLSLILMELGFKEDEIELGVRFENSRVESFYTIKKAKTLELGDRRVHFEEGDQIIVGFSHRYTEDELKRIMKIYFEEHEIYFNEKRTRALILCKK